MAFSMRSNLAWATSSFSTISNASSSTKSDHFPLIDLPLELRVMVYRLHLGKRRSVGLNISAPEPRPDLGVNLLRSCRRIYVEAIQYLYQKRWWHLINSTSSSVHVHSPINTPLYDDALYFKGTHSLTLARVERLSFVIPALWHVKSIAAPIRLDTIAKMKSLKEAKIYICFCGWANVELTNSSLLIGLVVQILSQIPQNVHIWWRALVRNPGGSIYKRCESSKASLTSVAKEWKVVRGCAMQSDQQICKSPTTTMPCVATDPFDPVGQLDE